MTIPTNEDFLNCAATWRGEHEGIRYELSWHGRSDYSPHGTWCYYIFLTSEQFYPSDWQKLKLQQEDREFAGSWHRHWSYDNFPDLEPHGGWTFGELSVYLGRDGKEHESVRVGCDYAHLWDHEGNFWRGHTEVEQDVKHSIDLLISMFPKRRPRCAYSGKYDDAEQFYTAVNGRTVHKSCIAKLSESSGGWRDWLPAEPLGTTTTTQTVA